MILGGKTITSTISDVYSFDGTSVFTLIGKLALPDAFPSAEPFNFSTNEEGSLIVGRSAVHRIDGDKNFSVYMKLLWNQ